MAKINFLLLIIEDEVDAARAAFAEFFGEPESAFLQARCEHPTHPGKMFYVCHSPGPASGLQAINDKITELGLVGPLLVLDVTNSDPTTELSSRGYTPGGPNWPWHMLMKDILTKTP